ncbi:MAG: ABC transporter ATP-binding protein [Vicinamibacterales bacterium]
MGHIEIRNVSKAFQSGGRLKPVLDDVSLSVARGEFVAIVGSMGCGKSTLLSLAAGLTVPDSGTVLIDGTPVTGIRPDVSIVFQNYALLPWYSALENVRLGLQAARPEWSRSQQRDHATTFLEKVGLGNALHRRPGQLSGGMRQRVAIARAFATEPDILFLDEPFGALDALSRGALQQELARMCASQEKPVTVLMISNNVDEALLLADRVVPMTRAPRATLAAGVPVRLPRPRDPVFLAHDPASSRVRADVVAALTGANRSGPRAGRAGTAARERHGALAVAMEGE